MTTSAATPAEGQAFNRLWSGFLSARVLVALALLALQLTGLALGQPVTGALLGASGAYLAATVALRWLRPTSPAPQHASVRWLSSIGIDLVTWTGLQFLQLQSQDPINYAPLYGFSVLMAGVLGTRTTALGTAAAATIVLLALAWWAGVRGGTDATGPYLGAALTGTAYFIVAWLAHQLSARLLREQQHAEQSRMAARTQEAVSHLVMEHANDGILVLDRRSQVRLANPMAQALLGQSTQGGTPFALVPEARWQPLVQLVHQTFAEAQAQAADITILHEGQSPMGLRARTWLTTTRHRPADDAFDILCVVFLQDLRAMEAQLRTEKMAAMGRMSAAVAHEIRNPLAAILQANQLLQEELTDAGQQRLADMVRQNAERLKRITEDVLDIARVQHQMGHAGSTALALDGTVQRIVQEWQASHPGQAICVALQAPGTQVPFDAEHLRRVLVNLLDNAQRHVSGASDALQILTQGGGDAPVFVQVWSDGAPLEKSVEQHLFEPFFSSESRSSGLGLYISRELCQRHGARLHYARKPLTLTRGSTEGNAFTITFRAASRPAGSAALFDTIVV